MNSAYENVSIKAKDIHILGGIASGKSFAAEIIIKAQDDFINDKAITKTPQAGKMFLERCACNAAKWPHHYEVISHGMRTHFTFFCRCKQLTQQR